MNRFKKSLPVLGGIITAIAASLCCIGPVFFALIGVGSVGVFSGFEAYRPYLIGLTSVFLGVAFFLTYRKREVVCEDGSCTIKSAGKWNKAGVWLATLIAAIGITFPYFGGALVASASQPLNEEAGKLIQYSTTEVKIEGMDCKACAAGLQATLGRIEGVQKAKVDYEHGNAIIVYDPTKLQSRALVGSINELGFAASLAETLADTQSKQN